MHWDGMLFALKDGLTKAIVSQPCYLVTTVVYIILCHYHFYSFFVRNSFHIIG